MTMAVRAATKELTFNKQRISRSRDSAIPQASGEATATAKERAGAPLNKPINRLSNKGDSHTSPSRHRETQLLSKLLLLLIFLRDISSPIQFVRHASNPCQYTAQGRPVLRKEHRRHGFPT